MLTSLNIGGLVAIGFDSTGRYMLAVSHDGRGVFDLKTWQHVARDATPAYPEAGAAIGIGPIAGEDVQVQEIDYNTGVLRTVTPDGKLKFVYQSGIVTVIAAGT